MLINCPTFLLNFKKIKMSNKQGYILGFSSAILYTLIFYQFDSYYYISAFFVFLIAVLSIPTIIAGLISIFLKGKKFGKIFGITCIIIHLISGIGNSYI